MCHEFTNTSHFPFARMVLVVFKKREFFLCLLHRKGRITAADIEACMHILKKCDTFLFVAILFLFDFLFVPLPPLMVVEWMHTPFWLAPIISFFLFFFLLAITFWLYCVTPVSPFIRRRGTWNAPRPVNRVKISKVATDIAQQSWENIQKFVWCFQVCAPTKQTSR